MRAILSGGVPAPGWGVVIHREHIESIRTHMDLALSVLGFSGSAYTDASLAGAPIRLQHITEVRERTR